MKSCKYYFDILIAGIVLFKKQNHAVDEFKIFTLF